MTWCAAVACLAAVMILAIFGFSMGLAIQDADQHNRQEEAKARKDAGGPSLNKRTGNPYPKGRTR